VLGRGVCFDDIEELTNVSAKVHRTFFIKFVSKFTTELYVTYLKSIVTSSNELIQAMNEYSKVSFSGCLGSIDCVYVIISRINCPYVHNNQIKLAYIYTIGKKDTRQSLMIHEVTN